MEQSGAIQISPSSVLKAGCLFLVLCLSGCDSTTAVEHLQRAGDYFAQAEYRTAVIELKNALQKDPELGEARLLLGRTQEVLGDYPSALREYERALDLGVESEALRVGLLRTKVRLGRHQEVIGELEPLGALTPVFAAILADAYLAGGDLELAKPLYAQAASLAEGNLGLGTIAWIQADVAGARAYLGRATDLGPKNRDAWIRKGEFELSQQQFDDAIEAFGRARELTGGELTGRLGLTRAYLAQGSIEAARREIDLVLESARGFFIAHYLDGLIHYLEEDVDGAEAALREVQRTVPDHAPTLYLMGAIKFRQGQLAQAEDSLQRFLTGDPHNESAAKLLASVRYRQNDLAGVQAALDPFIRTTKDAQILAMAGTVAMGRGESNQATELLERAVEMAPDAAAFRNQLAVSLLSIGEEARAATELQSALSVDSGQFQSDYLLAMLNLKNGDVGSALTAVERMLTKNPDSPIGHNLKGGIQLASGELEDAVRSFERSLEISPDFYPAVRNLARLDELRGDVAAARQRYQTYYALAEDDERPMLAIADIALRSGDELGAERALKDVVAGDPGSFRAQLGLARLYLMQNRIAEADVHAAAAMKLNGEAVDVLLLGTEVALRKGDQASARELAELLQARIAGGEPAASLLLAIGRTQRRAGLTELARENLERALALTGDDDRGIQIELARVDLQQNRIVEVRRRLATLSSQNSKDDELLLLEADVLRLEGELPRAAAAYRQLADADVRDGALRLAMLQLSDGHSDAALGGLDAWLARHPGDVGAQVLRADALLRTGEKRLAIAQYEELRAAENPVVLNNLAWLYMERGDVRALATARRAYELAPQSGDIADTLGWVLVQSGNPQAAIDHLLLSARQKPDNATVQYHLGVAYLEAGRTREGRAALERAVDLGGFPELEDARARLASAS